MKSNAGGIPIAEKKIGETAHLKSALIQPFLEGEGEEGNFARN
jgi:hypothetical protein